MTLVRHLIMLFILIPFTACVISKEKPIIAASAMFTVNQSIPMMARIDTGASRSSINAVDIKVKNANKKMKDNVGKQVSFNIVDAKGNKSPITTKILAVKTTKTPQGREHRYLVNLDLTWNGNKSRIKANLRDRSNLQYKLLIGRDWLDKNALVDVDPKVIIGAVADYLVADDFPITARIDTGAASTSINALNLKVHNSTEKMSNNVGKMISFDIVNNKGDVKHLSATIYQVTEITNAIGSEYRYKVPIKIQWRGKIQTLNMNLKDRSRLTHKMLIGRDWLSNNAIVDTSL